MLLNYCQQHFLFVLSCITAIKLLLRRTLVRLIILLNKRKFHVKTKTQRRIDFFAPLRLCEKQKKI